MKLALAVALSAVLPSVANAFCGFYVAGGDQQMFNDATQVVLMRKGTRTVLGNTGRSRHRRAERFHRVARVRRTLALA